MEEKISKEYVENQLLEMLVRDYNILEHQAKFLIEENQDIINSILDHGIESIFAGAMVLSWKHESNQIYGTTK